MTLLFIYISCKPQKREVDGIALVIEDEEQPVIRQDTVTIWHRVLEYRKMNTDSTLVVSLAEYVNTHDEMEEALYVPLLAYIYKHYDEGYDEGIYHSLYRIIKKTPNIGERIVSYLESFPKEQLLTTRKSFFAMLFGEYSEYNEEPLLETTKSAFIELFPFFNNEQYLVYLNDNDLLTSVLCCNSNTN